MWAFSGGEKSPVWAEATKNNNIDCSSLLRLSPSALFLHLLTFFSYLQGSYTSLNNPSILFYACSTHSKICQLHLLSWKFPFWKSLSSCSNKPCCLPSQQCIDRCHLGHLFTSLCWILLLSFPSFLFYGILRHTFIWWSIFLSLS